MPIGTLAGVAVRDMARFESYPLVVSQALLPMELLLAAETLQTTALITLKDRLVSPTAGITFLAHQPRIQALVCRASLGTHTRIGKEITHNVTVTGLSPAVKTKALGLKPAQNLHSVLHALKKTNKQKTSGVVSEFFTRSQTFQFLIFCLQDSCISSNVDLV